MKKMTLIVRSMLMPSSCAVTPLSDTARMRMPSRVPWTNQVSSSMSSTATATIAACFGVNTAPATSIGSVETIAG